MQNLITNPYITVLFLCGEDSPVFFPLEGIRCLYERGVDDGRHVLPANGGRSAKVFARDALATLSHEDIACFRSRALEIVDCRGALDPAAFFADVATRLPRYVRGHVGVVERLHGVHVFPDSAVLDKGDDPQWLYTVRFDARELWGDDADPTVTVSIDAFEPYLDPA